MGHIMVDNNIQKTKSKRMAFLDYLYQKVGDSELSMISLQEMKIGLDFSDDDVNTITDYLKAEGLIDYPAYGQISITHEGIKAMENRQLVNAQSPQARLSVLTKDLENTKASEYPDDPYNGLDEWISKATPIIRADWPKHFDDFLACSARTSWTNFGLAQYTGTTSSKEPWIKDGKEIENQKRRILQFLTGLSLLPSSAPSVNPPDARTVNIHVSDHAKISTLVVADLITESFNRIEKSEMSPDLKDLLQELAKAVKTLSTKIPEDIAQNMAKDVDSLTKEAASKSPRPEWYQFTIKGLIKAAQDIGEIAKPVFQIASSILALLLPKP